MRADRRDALLDFLLMAVADEGTTPFATDVLAGLRKVVRCEAVSYREWSPQELLELSLAADDPGRSCRSGGNIRRSDTTIHSPGDIAWEPAAQPRVARAGSPISDFISDREFRRRGLYAEVCKPLGVRAVMKVFLPTGGATGASFVFDTTGARSPRPTASSSSDRPAPGDNCGATRTRGGPIRRSSTPPKLPGSGSCASRHANGSSSPGRRQARQTPRSHRRSSSAPGPSASTLNTSTTSSKSAPGQKQPRSTPRSEWS